MLCVFTLSPIMVLPAWCRKGGLGWSLNPNVAKTTGVCRQGEKGQPGVRFFNFRHLADKEKNDL